MLRSDCSSAHRVGLVLAGVVWIAATPARALAVQVNYGTHAGTHVNYVNVTEDTAGPLPLFGAPIVSGDSIDFNPTGFIASSTNIGSDTTDSNLVFGVTAKSGSRIRSIILAEAGDTTLGGNVSAGSMGTASAVFAGGVLDIHEVDFVGINHISVPFSLTFTPSGGTFFLGTDGGGGPIFSTMWTGSVALDIEAILIANGFTIPRGPLDADGGATRISIDMDNTLQAVSELGTSATIGKKDFGVLAHVANVPHEPGGGPEVPEPAALAVFATLAWTLRRDRAAAPVRNSPLP
jgi:hypothetical protein